VADHAGVKLRFVAAYSLLECGNPPSSR